MSFAAPTFRLGHRPGLDGIRGIALITVIAAHSLTYLVDWHGPYGASIVQGAYVSVDVFFALSGFLITSLLLQERHRTGTNSLKHFYLRRALRLLPALFATLFAFGVYVVFSTHAGVGDYLRMVLKTLSYSANWFIPEDGFLTTWFGQSWSLAIEEQFYILWPLLFGALMVVSRNRPRLFAGVLAAGFVGACVWRPVLYQIYDEHYWEVYFRTDARLDQLIAGALLAYLMHRGWVAERPRPALCVFGLLAWGALLVGTDQFESFYYSPLGIPVVTVMTMTLLLGSLHQVGVGRILAWDPFRWLGRISYTMYIVHVFVFYAVSLHLPGEGRNLLRVLVANAIAMALTVAIHYLIELPGIALKERFGKPEARPVPPPVDAAGAPATA